MKRFAGPASYPSRTKSLPVFISTLFSSTVPKKYSIPNKIIEKAINSSMLKARQSKIHGKKLTPFLLEKVSSITKGKTLETNIQLMLNNAKLAARIAFALNK